MKYAILLIFFSAGVCKAQVSRKEVLENRIKMIAITVLNENEEKQEVVKEYYTVSGFDSSKHYDDQPAFNYKPKFDKQGRVIQLTRTDDQGREDEFHLFKYNTRDSSYTIEIVAHGAGTISFSRYTKKNICFEEIYSSTDTVIYEHNSLGKIKTVSIRDKGKILILATTKFDEKGLPVSTKSIGEDSKIVYYKFNERGLMTEEKYYSDENGKETLMEIRRYSYEYHK